LHLTPVDFAVAEHCPYWHATEDNSCVKLILEESALKEIANPEIVIKETISNFFIF
jgi:hypothetical protein